MRKEKGHVVNVRSEGKATSGAGGLLTWTSAVGLVSIAVIADVGHGGTALIAIAVDIQLARI
jgi:hypothetical protein